MGRTPSTNFNLPPHVRKKVTKAGKVYYYYECSNPRKWIALGGDYVIAMQKYAELENGIKPGSKATFVEAANRYLTEVMPFKAIETQRQNVIQLKYLLEFFGGENPAPLDEIKPIHVRQYMDGRKGSQTSANREKALLSHIFNKARNWGYTEKSNPCEGIENYKEKGRDVYVSDNMYKSVYDVADQPLKDAMDLAYLTGQRTADTIKMDIRDIVDDALIIKQNKTGKKLRVAIVGELLELINRIEKRKTKLKIHSTRLIINEVGQPLGRDALRFRFDKARDLAGIKKDDFQFRDLRAKAGTDTEELKGMAAAKDQLGHANESMTSHYVRHRKGKLVSPTK